MRLGTVRMAASKINTNGTESIMDFDEMSLPQSLNAKTVYLFIAGLEVTMFM